MTHFYEGFNIERRVYVNVTRNVISHRNCIILERQLIWEMCISLNQKI